MFPVDRRAETRDGCGVDVCVTVVILSVILSVSLMYRIIIEENHDFYKSGFEGVFMPRFCGDFWSHFSLPMTLKT